MSRIAVLLRGLLLVAAALAAMDPGGLARAQQPAGPAPALRRRVVQAPAPAPDEDEAAEQEDEAVLRQREQVAQAERERYLQLYFDRQVYGGRMREGIIRLQLEAALASRIDLLHRACGLSEAQVRKLRAAGHGDIKRFLDHAAAERSRFRDVGDLRNFAAAIQKAAKPLVPERAALLAGAGPILRKAVPSTLTVAQRVALEKDARDRRDFRYRAAVRWTAVMLTRSLGLVDDQRRRLEALLLEETHAPDKFDSYDSWIVMYQASRIPEARIRPIFDDVQWRVLTKELDAARRWETRLKNAGLLPEQRPDVRPDAAPPAELRREIFDANIKP